MSVRAMMQNGNLLLGPSGTFDWTLGFAASPCPYASRALTDVTLNGGQLAAGGTSISLTGSGADTMSMGATCNYKMIHAGESGYTALVFTSLPLDANTLLRISIQPYITVSYDGIINQVPYPLTEKPMMFEYDTGLWTAGEDATRIFSGGPSAALEVPWGRWRWYITMFINRYASPWVNSTSLLGITIA